jgi:TolA-binding protein
MSHEPSRYVQPDVSEARVNRLWSHLAERIEQRPARAWRWLVLCTALGGAAAGAWFLTHGRLEPSLSERTVLADAKLETAGDSLAVTLLDGSKVSLASRTELSVRGNQPTSVALSLGHGEVACDVTHREGRSFTVLAGDVEVRVVGTRFNVKATRAGLGQRVEVNVLRGVVEVRSRRRPGIVARVAAGQSWVQNGATPAEASAAPAAATPPVPAEAPLEAASAAKPETSVSGAPAASAPALPSARELFERAGDHRRAGDAAGAAHAYEELLRLHPSDGRAGLSAFELGRLRMDRLADPAGAISALERALAAGVGPSFREDALARLVTIYAAQGNSTACARARDSYLRSYPGGVHAGAVASRCGGR